MELPKATVRRLSEREYMFTFEGEDHTMGSLLQHYLQGDERVDTVYYAKPHPLEDKVSLYVKLSVDADPVEILRDALEKIARDAREFREKLIEAYREAGIDVEG